MGSASAKRAHQDSVPPSNGKITQILLPRPALSGGPAIGPGVNAGQASASHHSSTASTSVSISSVAIMAHQTAVGKSESIYDLISS
jgi:hypothetical protein